MICSYSSGWRPATGCDTILYFRTDIDDPATRQLCIPNQSRRPCRVAVAEREKDERSRKRATEREQRDAMKAMEKEERERHKAVQAAEREAQRAAARRAARFPLDDRQVSA